MKTELQNAEVECLKLKKAINDNHRLAQKAAGDAVERAILTGELLIKWKELLPHGRFEPFTETHFEGSLRTSRSYMLAAKRLSALSNRQRSAVLDQESSISGLLESLKPQNDSVAAGREARTSEGTPVAPKGGSNPPATADSGEENELGTTPQEQDPRPPRSGTDKPAVSQDYGTCPNCASKKWTADDFGVSCAKCNHPHGEPTGGTDEDRVGTQRSKTVKTAEALMRAFDDLNLLSPKLKEHAHAITTCKLLLTEARAWK